MKKLKLEVGKTYRSREGKEVKIVDFCKELPYHPYKGNEGKWYRADGMWANRKSPYDLIEEVPSETTRHIFTIPNGKEITAARYTFTIPEGTKGINVSKEGNRIVVEMVPEAKEPKPGDVCINEYDSVYVFKEDVGNGIHEHYALLGESGRLSFASRCHPGRPATPEEAQPLWDALKKAGKRWNGETLEVEEIPEIDRIREWAEKHYSNHQGIAEAIEAYLKYREESKKA